MKYSEGRQKFIKSWGELGMSWGISKTMGQIHALLLISPKPKCSVEIMEHLDISRGNASQSLCALQEWGVVHKVEQEGSRREYFIAEKDMWSILRMVISIRKKKELEPMLKVISDISKVESNCPDSDAFCQLVKQLSTYGQKTNSALESMIALNSDDLIDYLFQPDCVPIKTEAPKE